MLLSSEIKNFHLRAIGENLGKVTDFLFDDRTWNIRWFVVDTGTWLSERKVLIHPSAIIRIDQKMRAFSVKLTKAQVEASPVISQDQPVSQQMEASLSTYYDSGVIWGNNYFGDNALVKAFSPPPLFDSTGPQTLKSLSLHGNPADPHLRSVAAISSYRIQANDGNIGHVEDFLMSEDDFGIRYLIVDTRDWLPGKHVLVSPYAVQDISWADQKICLNIDRDTVKAAPPWKHGNRVDTPYEKQLHSHYGWPGYGF
jgi:hypothetical protein